MHAFRLSNLILLGRLRCRTLHLLYSNTDLRVYIQPIFITVGGQSLRILLKFPELVPRRQGQTAVVNRGLHFGAYAECRVGYSQVFGGQFDAASGPKEEGRV